MQAGLAAVNGTELYYEVAGQGTPIVFVHGFSLDRRMWDDQFEALSPRHRVIRYDIRGFGKSALPAGSAYRNCDDLRALLDYLEAPLAHVVGLSMGGVAALHHALEYPAATRSLVLVDTALDGHPWMDEWDQSLDVIEAYAKRSGAKAGNERWLNHELFASVRERPEVRARLEQIVGDYSGWSWVNDSPAQGIDPRSIARLHEIDAPTLVIVGERDLPDFQIIASTLADGIPNARKVVIKAAGHMSNMEQPAEFNSIVSAFLGEVEAR
jgi:3-oxoadipate enol-lactonase